MCLVVHEDKAPQDPSQRQMNSYGGQKSHHSCNCPIFTTMNTYIQDNANNADNATAVDKDWSDDESNIIDGIVKPILASLNRCTSQNKVVQFSMSPVISFCQLLHGYYEGSHDTDGYWARGPEFQPPHIW